jgi:predicted nucleotidyltransferase
MLTHNIVVPHDAIIDFCQRYHIQRLAFFGSVLRDDFSPSSDIDVLVEFEPGRTPGLITLAGMETELSGILDRKTDIRTPADLSRYFRQDVIDRAQVYYSAK